LCNDELLFLRAIELGPVDGLMVEGSSHPPLFRLVVGSILDSSASDLLLRIPSIICVLATLVIWHLILQRLFDEPYLVAAILALTACNAHWLEAGFLMLPYAMLTMLGSAHALFWLRLVASDSRLDFVGFVLTGVGSIWIHFYGANLLVADQLIWVFIVIRERKFIRLWLSSSFVSLLLVLPVIPIAWFYVQVEKPYALVEIENHTEYFLTYSQQFFSSLTFNLKSLGFLVLIWYGIVLASVFRFLGSGKPRVDGDEQSGPNRIQMLILAGMFLAGLPAAQAHSLIFEKAMWPRYTLVASWTHWPLLFLFLQQFPISKVIPAAIAVVGIATGIFGFSSHNQFRPNVAFDYNNEIRVLNEEALAGDGILVQDFDFWIGSANGDRLWSERYCPVELEHFTGEAMNRFEVYENGIDFTAVPASIERFWVYSGLFNEELLRSGIPENWKLDLIEYGDCPWFPLARFKRVEQPTLQ
jgi:hypothetical protein